MNLDLLVTTKRWTRDACKSCSIDTGRQEIGIVDARRQYKQMLDTSQNIIWRMDTYNRTPSDARRQTHSTTPNDPCLVCLHCSSYSFLYNRIESLCDLQNENENKNFCRFFNSLSSFARNSDLQSHLTRCKIFQTDINRTYIKSAYNALVRFSGENLITITAGVWTGVYSNCSHLSDKTDLVL